MELDNPIVGNGSVWGLFIADYYTVDAHIAVGSPLTKNKSIFIDYHDDDQNGSGKHLWGCPVFGTLGGYYESSGALGYNGLFHDWKMSGSWYNDYTDNRVGSPITITSVYHDCGGDGGNIYWPIFGFKWNYGTQYGVFGDNDTSMISPAPTIGSQI